MDQNGPKTSKIREHRILPHFFVFFVPIFPLGRRHGALAREIRARLEPSSLEGLLKPPLGSANNESPEGKTWKQGKGRNEEGKGLKAI